jgi:hypothetical protein
MSWTSLMPYFIVSEGASIAFVGDYLIPYNEKIIYLVTLPSSE